MATFEVSDFYTVPIKVSEKGFKTFDRPAIASWIKSDPILSGNGVYVFSIKAGKGCKPWYIGKAERQTFSKEAFNARNQLQIQDVINDQKGTLLVQFITQVKARGKPNLSQVREIETFLIGLAAERNHKLINIHGTKKPDWVLNGVINTGKGKPTKIQSEFKRLMGI
ncbi:MAG: hypothetical protein KDJ69_00715 [Nitratireductor sp.]|nr:hypothetical protein [Nitratireductor sp.]